MTAPPSAPHFRLAAPSTAVTLAALVVLLAAGSVPLYALVHQPVLVNGVENIVLAVAFASIGLVIARREPRNPIGWLMLVGPGLSLLSIDGTLYAELTFRPGYHLPFGLEGILLDASWFVGSGALALVILLFPDGALPSPRWRWVLWSYLAVGACYMAISYAYIVSVPGHDVRIGSGGIIAPDLAGWFGTLTRLSGAVFAAFWLSFVVAQVLSWRHSSGERRQQLKWLMSGAATLAVSQAIDQTFAALDPNPAPWTNALLDLITALGLAALPLSIGVAILRYRLYEIDRIISRTLSYALVTGLIVGVYVGVVLLATDVLAFSGSAGVAISTLIAAVLFSPLRRRVQRVVDRRFNRARYDADKTIAAFAAHLQDAVDLNAVRDDLARVVSTTLDPAHVSVWVPVAPMSERLHQARPPAVTAPAGHVITTAATPAIGNVPAAIPTI